jgi:F0F1-type ATP synthase delta subunit
MKTFKQILEERKFSNSDLADLEFIAMQFSNDENSSDKEMIAHLTSETGLSKSDITKLVKKGRGEFLKNPLMSMDKEMALLQKIIS